MSQFATPVQPPRLKMNKENTSCFESKVLTPVAQVPVGSIPLASLSSNCFEKPPTALRQRSVDLDQALEVPDHGQAFVTVGYSRERRRDASNHSIEALTSIEDMTSILHHPQNVTCSSHNPQTVRTLSLDFQRYVDRVYEQLRAHVAAANGQDEGIKFPAVPFKVKPAPRYLDRVSRTR